VVKQIDRLLDNAHLASQLGCRGNVDLTPEGSRKFNSDSDLRKFFAANKRRVLCQARFRDGEYTIHWAEVSVPAASKKKVVKKTGRAAAARKRASKKKDVEST